MIVEREYSRRFVLWNTLKSVSVPVFPVGHKFPGSGINTVELPPARRDPNLLSKLRKPRMYRLASNKTKKYHSFLNYGL